MKKIFLIFSFIFCAFADELELAKEYEKQGKYKEAMQIYKKIALGNLELSAKEEQNSTKNSLTTQEQTKEHLNTTLEPALANYLGEQTSFLPFGITPYKMNYFLPVSYSFKNLGRNHEKTETKFQISIKKKLFENLLGFDEKYYFAYTQVAWWQLYKHSSPFRESNYQPEAFVDIPLNLTDFNFLDRLRFGILHESNGKSDRRLESRSWNRVYVSTVMQFDEFLLTPRFWLRIPERAEDDDNPDIRHYLGNFDLNFSYLGDKFFINTLLRNNLNLSHNKGAVQIDLGYDLLDNGIFWYVQYFNGYGESLIHYNKRSHRLSTGILLAY